ncbi:amino acid/amide ABC transporter ATP-binding protein 1 (HAAT family) [Eoetvoesiella caeni]|uniref:Amino acid/amide ABC transporter ATP-binding protein 1 (HAAT family) n=2 Tax=Eoetvoesiella caeni TaxID=645616 RepID=A0A366GZT7_9BURK|nr:amino acid/amide ABC transporter ATP-binding protein 1 (HAAT family) [Eoetvoesiella caeni]
MLKVEHLVKHFGGLKATDDLSLEVYPGELHAVIGPNGAGKTTLIHQLSGEYFPDSGRIIFDGMDITRKKAHSRALSGLGRSYQISSVFMEFSAIQNVMMALLAHSGHSFRFWHPVLKERRLLEPAMASLEQVGLGSMADQTVANMAHGQRRQLELAMVLVTQPKLLLLDEPMAGMSQLESERVIEILASLKGRYAILLVEHDMDAVFALADRISVLVYGHAIATGTPEEIRSSALVREAYLGDPEDVV